MTRVQFEELVENYYYNRLDDKAKTAFETRRVVDAPFGENVDNYLQNLALVHQLRSQQLKSRFEAREDQIRRKAVRLKVMRFAALISLSLVIPITFMQHVSAKRNKQITAPQEQHISEPPAQNAIHLPTDTPSNE